MNHERLPQEQLSITHEQQPNPYAIEPLMHQLRPVAAVIMADSEETHGRQYVMSSADRKNYISEKIPAVQSRTQAGLYVIGLYEQSADDQPLEAFVDQLTQRINLRTDDTTMPALQRVIDNQKRYEHRARDVIRAIEYVSEGSDAVQYGVAKMLAAHPADIVDDMHAVVVRDYAVIGAMQDETDLFSDNVHRIEHGDYDEHIARDLLLEHLEGTAESSGKQIDREVENMLKLTARLVSGGEITPEVIDQLSQPEALVLWPQEARRLYEQRKEHLIVSLQKRFDTASRRALAYGYVSPMITERDLQVLVDQNSADLKVQTRHNPQRARMEEIQRSTHKRAKVSKGAGKTATKQTAQSRAEKEMPPRTLVFTKKSGERFEEGSDQFKAMVEDYISKHPGQGLELAVEKVLDYLRNPVVSNGLTKGVVAMSNASVKFADNSAKPRKLFRLRPNQATGIKLASRTAQKMRVFYATDKDDASTILIMGIADKTTSGSLLKSLGIRSSGNIA